jgi:hypothetical protein
MEHCLKISCNKCTWVISVKEWLLSHAKHDWSTFGVKWKLGFIVPRIQFYSRNDANRQCCVLWLTIRSRGVRRPSSSSVSRARFVTAGAIDVKLCTYIPLGKCYSQTKFSSSLAWPPGDQNIKGGITPELMAGSSTIIIGTSNSRWHSTRVFDLIYFWRSQWSKFKTTPLLPRFVTIWPRTGYSCMNIYIYMHHLHLGRSSPRWAQGPWTI